MTPVFPRSEWAWAVLLGWLPAGNEVVPHTSAITCMRGGGGFRETLVVRMGTDVHGCCEPRLP